MKQFVPGIPIKRYPPDIDPQQSQIPMMMQMVALDTDTDKIVRGKWVYNRAYYSEYKEIIEYYIDKEGYNEKTRT